MEPSDGRHLPGKGTSHQLPLHAGWVGRGGDFRVMGGDEGQPPTLGEHTGDKVYSPVPPLVPHCTPYLLWGVTAPGQTLAGEDSLGSP